MQRVTMVRYTTRPEAADSNEALSRAVFDQLRTERPDGLAYALLRDGDAFVHLFVNLQSDSAEGVTGLESFKAFQQEFDERCLDAPEVQRLGMGLVESYGFGQAAGAP